ncbi:hypothetical protein [Sphaerisporangium aureirubrum]|uniref:Uncharacterized protein n=1 Tax=Sphaerisporangium aureirubrum TaxID=1544736 RepID=A0ABW1NND3_9ACTN
MVLVKEVWATAFRANPSESGDRHAVKRVEHLLGEAEWVHARGAMDEAPAWTAWYEETELRAESGNCWRLLGDHGRALANAEVAVTKFQDRFLRSAQINRVHAADAYLRLEEVEQALDAGRPAISAIKALTSPRTVDFIRRFDRDLDLYTGIMAVREFRDHLRAELAA